MYLRFFLMTTILLSTMLPSISMMPKNKCKIEQRVRVALKTLNRASVTEVTDCVLDVGECDAIGNEVKGDDTAHDVLISNVILVVQDK